MSQTKTYSAGFLESLFRQLYQIRIFETRCIKLYRQGLIRGYLHPYLGEEAIAVGVCAALRDQDYIASTHRGHGHCIARGADLKKMTAEIMGRRDGYCKGRGGSMHIADAARNNLGANGIVGAGIPIGAGAALAARVRGDDAVTAVFASDGAANHGTFGEGLNFAAAFDLPLLLVCENNQYAVSTPIAHSTRETEIYKRGAGLGVESVRVDGNDVLEVYETAKRAVDLCVSGQGPFLMEALTYRHAGHHVNDPGAYMPQETLEHYKSIDPCLRARKLLLDQEGYDEARLDGIIGELEGEMDEAVDFAKDSPFPAVETFLEEIRNY